MTGLRWYQSLNFKGLTALVTIGLWLMIGIFVIMEFKGKPFVEAESLRWIEQAGSTVVEEIHTYTQRIEATAATLATTVEHLPKTVDTMMEVVPPILDSHGDFTIAGGGVWPEPYAFDPTLERRSFFWGRDQENVLRYYDSYNQSKEGYHQEEYYAASRYAPPGECVWSRSYKDPFTLEPMVTCLVATYEAGKFTGGASLDVKLAGLNTKMGELQARTGGYAFLVDRNNKFITFPQPELVRSAKDGRDFITARDFATREPRFTALANELDTVRQEVLSRGKCSKYSSETTAAIAASSRQIDAEEAQFITVMLSCDRDMAKTHYTLNIDTDYLLQTPVTAFYFHVPDTFWTLVIVKPTQEIGAVANTVTHWLMVYLGLTSLLIFIGAYFLLQRLLITPLVKTTDTVALAEDLVADKAFDKLQANQATYCKHDEIGILARVFNKLLEQVVVQHRELEQANDVLEDKVRKRTADLEQASEEIKTLNEYLKEENVRMSTELDITRQLQQMILPRAAELSQFTKLDIAGFMEPATEVGGDYYDVLDCDGHTIIGIGDVTGHGLASGVLMLMVQTAVRALTLDNSCRLEECLGLLNRAIYENIQRMNTDKNLTLMLLDYKDGKLILSGQHEEVIVIRQHGEVERIDTLDLGFMIGVEPDISQFIARHEITLQPGDGVVLYTDGMTEAKNSASEMYGVERLCQVLQQHRHLTAWELQQQVITDVKIHLGTNEVADDITLLILKRR